MQRIKRGEVKIQINGKTTQHQIGDHYWYVYPSDENPFELEACESKEYVREIRIGEHGHVYYCFGTKKEDGSFFTEMNKPFNESRERGMFWTREEAEEWIANNVPEQLVVSERTEVFAFFKNQPEYIRKMTIVRLSVGTKHDEWRMPYRVRYMSDFYNEAFDAEDFGKLSFFHMKKLKKHFQKRNYLFLEDKK